MNKKFIIQIVDKGYLRSLESMLPTLKIEDAYQFKSEILVNKYSEFLKTLDIENNVVCL